MYQNTHFKRAHRKGGSSELIHFRDSDKLYLILREELQLSCVAILIDFRAELSTLSRQGTEKGVRESQNSRFILRFTKKSYVRSTRLYFSEIIKNCSNNSHVLFAPVNR